MKVSSHCNIHFQLYLEENGKVDFQRTKAEAIKVEAAKSSAASIGAQKNVLRRRRTQARGIDLGLTPEMMKELVLEPESEAEGFVFESFLDCKIGVSFQMKFMFDCCKFTSYCIVTALNLTGTRILSMVYRKRADFGLRRSFLAADGPSSFIYVLNQKIESAFSSSPHLRIFWNIHQPTFLCSPRSLFLIPNPSELYSVCPITFDTTVLDHWQRATM
jgi:hypothetical protein